MAYYAFAFVIFALVCAWASLCTANMCTLTKYKERQSQWERHINVNGKYSEHNLCLLYTILYADAYIV